MQRIGDRYKTGVVTAACVSSLGGCRAWAVWFRAEALQQAAAYFQALFEPIRLRILNLLRDGERNVGELAELCEYTSAKISRHLAILSKHGLVARENRGNSVQDAQSTGRTKTRK